MRNYWLLRLIATVLSACQGANVDVTESARAATPPCDWTQFAKGPEHRSQACTEVFSLGIVGRFQIDPAALRKNDDRGFLSTHYGSPVTVGDWVFLPNETGEYTGLTSPETQIWGVKALHYEGGVPVEKWTFESDWKPVTWMLTNAYQAIYQTVSANGSIYALGQGGSIHRLDVTTGRVLATIVPAEIKSAATVAMSAPSADGEGNIYYTASRFEKGLDQDATSWLVKVLPSNAAIAVPWSTIARGTPAPDDLCVRNAFEDPSRCGAQRPTANAAPAIRADGTIFLTSSSRRPFQTEYPSFIVAVAGTTMTNRFTVTLAGHIDEIDGDTGLPVTGRASDILESSVVILPDGGFLYGSYSAWNFDRGYLYRFSSTGEFMSTFPYGWETTPAVYEHDGSCSVVLNQNNFNTNVFQVLQLDCNLQRIEWSFEVPHPLDCVRNSNDVVTCEDRPAQFRDFLDGAPPIDPLGNVYSTNADGFIYKIGQGGVLLGRTFLGVTLESLSAESAIDSHGNLWMQNAGDYWALGATGARQALNIVPASRGLHDVRRHGVRSDLQ